MWQELSLIHRKRISPLEGMEGENESPEFGGWHWRTCLRDIFFLEPGISRLSLRKEDEIYGGTEAHRFLLEICAGLQSPLFGETEVFGQFRAFCDQQLWHPAWMPLLAAVEEDVKKIRRLYLKDLGAQSYGSLARRRVPEGEPLVLVGSGRLAQDLLPWLEKNPITLLVRDLRKREGWWEKTRVCSWENPVLPSYAHWVLAAPVSNLDLERLWAGKSLGTVIDFRGEFTFGTPPSSSYFNLSSLFGELESVRSALKVKKQLALDAAKQYSRQRETSICHRPFGWEDAFA